MTPIRQLQNKLMHFEKGHLPFLVFILLLIPALFINLGLMPLRTDEPTRAIVAFEMMQSGNYFFPTIGGQPYLNKPPMYNWIVAGAFAATGSYHQIWFRLPMIISLLAFGLSIFFILRKETGTDVAWVAAIGTILSGRILFYDSMLGLIDITYGWTTFLMLYSFYYYHHRKKYYALFLIVYLLAAFGFLLKGFSSVVFVMASIAALVFYSRSWRPLFHPGNFIGASLFFVLVSLYFWKWSATPSEISIKDYLIHLWTESGKRTMVESSGWRTVKHIVLFPGYLIYHFAPFTVLWIAAIRKDFLSLLNQQKFLKFMGILCLVNIVPYWLSPEIYPRYLFMFIPILIGIPAWFYFRKQDDKRVKLIRGIFLFGAAGLTVAYMGALFYEHTRTLSYAVPAVIILFILSIIILFMMIRTHKMLLLYAGFILLIGRIAFDIFVLPVRYKLTPESEFDRMSAEIARITANSELRTYYWNAIDHELVWGIEKYRNDILYFDKSAAQHGIFYITNVGQTGWDNFEVIYEFYTRWEHTPLRVVKLKSSNL